MPKAVACHHRFGHAFEFVAAALLGDEQTRGRPHPSPPPGGCGRRCSAVPPPSPSWPALRESITFDNDTAFAQHALLRTMRAMTTWFCDAYASWQKGGVENANGRLRRWLPRQIDIDKLSDEEIQDIVITANLTP